MIARYNCYGFCNAYSEVIIIVLFSRNMLILKYKASKRLFIMTPQITTIVNKYFEL